MSGEKSATPSGPLNDVLDRKKMLKMNIRSRELLIATTDDDLETIDEILKDEISINFQDEDGNSALHWAVENSDIKTIEFLLSKGAAINIRNNKDETPLDLAKRIQRQDSIKALEQPLDPKSQIQSSREELSVEEHEGKMDQVAHISDETSNGMLIKDKKVSSENEIDLFRGNLHRLKAFLLFLHRGVSCNYSFYLARDTREAENFYNLVFTYEQAGKKNYRLLQTKHTLDQSNVIAAHNLLTQNDDYSLINSFFSYQDFIKDKHKDDLIKDFTISTNINFDFENLKGAQIKIEKIKDKDNLLDMKSSNKKSTRYTFSKDIVPSLMPKLQKYMEDNHLTITSLDEKIKDFLDHLVFAVDQPNEIELSDTLREEIGGKFDFIAAVDEYYTIYMTTLNWLKGKEKNVLLSHQEGKELFEKIRRGIPVSFHARDPMKSFFGRREELNLLHKALQGEGNIEKSKIVCLKGSGGIGKSELARKYINTYSQMYDNKILWINAENYETLAQSFRSLACDTLKISTKNKSGEEKGIKAIVEDVYDFFSNGRSLFIFDNAEKYKSENEFDNGIDEFLPSLMANCYEPSILVTSRNQKWPKSMKVLTLNVFKEEEAIIFLEKSINLNDDFQKKHIQELAKLLKFFPLALELAVAYVRIKDQYSTKIGSKFNINDYLKSLKERITGVNFENSEDSDGDYIQEILSTWDSTLDDLKHKENGDDAMKILNVLAYLLPDEIPIQLCLSLVNDEEKLKKALELLKQYSIIRVEHTQLYLHRLIQQVIRMKLKKQNEEQDVLAKALKLFNQFHRCNLVPDTLDHAISVWNHLIKYELIEEVIPLSTYIGVKLISNARFEQAYSFGSKLSNVLNDERIYYYQLNVYSKLYEIKCRISTALLNKRKLDLASNSFEELHNLEKNVRSFDSTFKVGGRSIPKSSQKKELDEALKWNIKRLENCEIRLGKKHPITLFTKSNIGEIFMQQHRFNEASKTLQEVYEIQKNTLGKRHSATLDTKYKIACVLMNQQKFDKALSLLQDILCSIQEITMDDKFLIMNTKTQIMIIFETQQKFTQALQIAEEIFYTKKTIFGDNYPIILRAQTEIAKIYAAMGKYDIALKMVEEISNKQNDILYSHHLDVLFTQTIKARILSDIGKNNDAISLLQEIINKSEVVFGKNDFNSLILQDELAEIFEKQGHYDKALEIFQNVLRIRRNNFGEDDFYTLISKFHIAVIFSKKSENNKAMQIFQEIYDELKRSKTSYGLFIQLIRCIVAIFVKENKPDEVLKFYRELIDLPIVYTVENRDRCDDMRRTMLAIGNVLMMSGKGSEAFQLIQDFEMKYKASVSQTMSNGTEMQSTLLNPENLLNAVKKCDLNKIKFFIKNGEDVNLKDNDNFSLLHYAVNSNSLSIVNILLENGADVTQITKKGNTPLHIATSKNYEKIVDVLLKHASRYNLKNFINAKTTASGTAPLHIAAKNGSFTITKSLLKHGAMFNIENENGETPLQLSTNQDISNLLEALDELFDEATKLGYIKSIHKFKPDELELLTTARNNLGYDISQATKDKRDEYSKQLELELLGMGCRYK